MTIANTEGPGRPPAAKRLLLEAALCWNPQKGLASWNQWKRAHEIESTSRGQRYLLGEVARNLAQWNPADENLPLLRQMQFENWANGEILCRAVRPAVAALLAKEIPVLLLPCASLSAALPRERALGALTDFAILVPTDAALEAMRCLEDLGFRPRNRHLWPPRFRALASHLTSCHSLPFRGSSAGELYLHWRALFERSLPSSESELWSAALSTDWLGQPVKVPCAADQLLFVIAQSAMKFIPASDYKWMMDATLILRADAGMDWARLIDQARRRRLSLRAHLALEYLRQHFEAPIPESITRALAEGADRAQRAEQRAHDRGSRPVRGLLAQLWHHHRRLSPHGSLCRDVVSFPRFLCRLWNLQWAREIPFHALYLLYRERKRRLGGSRSWWRALFHASETQISEME